MLKFAPNLSTMFTEVPFLERFEKAKQAGFQFVEFQFPYAHSSDEVKKQLDMHGLQTVLFNLPPGDWDKGDRGIAIFSDRQDEFKQSVKQALEYAQIFECTKMHCMAGVLPEDGERMRALETFKENVRYCAEQFGERGLTVLLEPINTYDMPNYFLSNVELAIEILDELALPNVKLQFDFYHMQRIQGELINTFKKYKDRIGHVQIADNPGRHEPGTGEINYDNIFRMLAEEGYDGFIGLEYIPKDNSENSLSWLRK